MAAKKTLEEIRESTRERQKRWREKYRRKHLERVKEVYGRSNAQKFSADGVTPGELDRYEKRVVQETTRVSMDDVEGDPGVMAQQREMRRLREGGGREPVVKESPLAEVVSTSEEHRVEAQLERFKAKREEREGVEVEM